MESQYPRDTHTQGHAHKHGFYACLAFAALLLRVVAARGPRRLERIPMGCLGVRWRRPSFMPSPARRSWPAAVEGLCVRSRRPLPFRVARAAASSLWRFSGLRFAHAYTARSHSGLFPVVRCVFVCAGSERFEQNIIDIQTHGSTCRSMHKRMHRDMSRGPYVRRKTGHGSSGFPARPIGRHQMQLFLIVLPPFYRPRHSPS